tara:strand:- start:14 stop:187 length:174 start_codon:yes stop_codon:yes gene_type:complete
MFKGFIDGLKKSFSGKDHLRNINKCKVCNKPAFTNICLYCKTEQDYDKSQENGRDNV